ncbi:MAG: hypothetical protein NC548_15675 [Lachnospiraceae bacterium]|nr:hypothetical protein [Lachnospiraceae bacterium]
MIFDTDNGELGKTIYNNKVPLYTSNNPYNAYLKYERMCEEAFRDNILFIADFGVPKEQYRRNTGFHFKRTDKIDDLLPYFIIGEFHDDEVRDIYNPSVLRVDDEFRSREFVNDSYSAFDCFMHNRTLRGNYSIHLVSTIKDRYNIIRTGERKIADYGILVSKDKRWHYKKIITYRSVPNVDINPNIIPFHAIACMTDPLLIEGEFKEL